MALSYQILTDGRAIISGLSLDIKPFAPLSTWTFLETDTSNRFAVSGGLWVLDTNTTYCPIENRIESRISDPANPAVGQMWLRTDIT